MKSYVDFIADIMLDPSIVQDLDTQLPFAQAADLQQWFTAKGYALNVEETEMLFANQSSLIGQQETVNY